MSMTKQIDLFNGSTNSILTPDTVCDDSEESSLTSNSSSSSSVTESWINDQVAQPHVGYKKVLVTGGAGFIGSHVADVLLDRGDDVVIVDEMNDYYDVRFKEQNLKVLLDKYGSERVQIYRVSQFLLLELGLQRKSDLSFSFVTHSQNLLSFFF